MFQADPRPLKTFHPKAKLRIKISSRKIFAPTSQVLARWILKYSSKGTNYKKFKQLTRRRQIKGSAKKTTTSFFSARIFYTLFNILDKRLIH